MTYNKANFIQQNRKSWEIEGGLFYVNRERLRIPRSKIAEMTSFSQATIAKFEKGKPIRNRKYLIASYQMALKQLKQQILNNINLVDDIN